MSQAYEAAVVRLEQLIERAAEEIESLRAQNRTLSGRIEELEQRAQRAEETVTSSEEARQEERREVCERVEKLAGGLESILEQIEQD